MSADEPINSQDPELEAFARKFGRTMMIWAQLESNLSSLFRVVLLGFSNIPELTADRQARAIFFSTSGFSSRADMLRAAVATSSLSSKQKEVALLSVNKAKTYSSTRNALAHGYPQPIMVVGVHVDESGAWNSTGHKHITHDVIHMGGLDKCKVREHELDRIASNFRYLATCIGEVQIAIHDSDDVALEACRVAIDGLPSVASATKMSKKQRGRALNQRITSKQRRTRETP